VSIADNLRAALAEGCPAVLVTVREALGSTPREAGAAMLVTADALAGTVGGGALELEAVLEARRMLDAGAPTTTLDVPLGPAIGQCCGGRVVLDLQRADLALLARMERDGRAARAAAPAVVVFGAGHTGQALARALQPLPFRLLVVDGREDRLGELPADVARRLTPLPEETVAEAQPGSAFVVMTHDHGLDFLLAAAALRRRDAAYVGMIGSRSKRVAFGRYLRDVDPALDPGRLVLPIGGSAVRDKRPEVIAALVAAELVVTFARRVEENRCTGFAQAQNECNKDTTEPSWTPAHAATP